MLLNPAPAWGTPRSDFVTLWHGCTSGDATKIRSGINLSACRIDTDFGRGFYTTTLERQARQWAWTRYYDLPLSKQRTSYPVTLKFRVPRNELGKLQSLHFVLGSHDNDDFWSLVQHCRQSVSTPNDHKHRAPAQSGWYDMVGGPIAAFWQQRVAMIDADQISFHTTAGIKVLDTLMRSGNPADFQINRVV